MILLVVFAAIQAALHFHARNVAQLAAAEAVTAGSTTTGTNGTARAAAEHFISTAGDGILRATVSVSRKAGTVTATVQGRSLAVLPLIPTPMIRQTVSGAIEQPPA